MENKKPGRITDYNKQLPIVELYYCVQSEGSRSGMPTVCVRTTGCTHRCFFGAGGWSNLKNASISAGVNPSPAIFCRTAPSGSMVCIFLYLE